MSIRPPIAGFRPRRFPWLLLLVLLLAQSEALTHRTDHLAHPDEALDCEVCLLAAALDSPLAAAGSCTPMATPLALSTPVHPPCWPVSRRVAHHPRDPPVPPG